MVYYFWKEDVYFFLGGGLSQCDSDEKHFQQAKLLNNIDTFLYEYEAMVFKASI